MALLTSTVHHLHIHTCTPTLYTIYTSTHAHMHTDTVHHLHIHTCTHAHRHCPPSTHPHMHTDTVHHLHIHTSTHAHRHCPPSTHPHMHTNTVHHLHIHTWLYPCVDRVHVKCFPCLHATIYTSHCSQDMLFCKVVVCGYSSWLLLASSMWNARY